MKEVLIPVEKGKAKKTPSEELVEECEREIEELSPLEDARE